MSSIIINSFCHIGDSIKDIAYYNSKIYAVSDNYLFRKRENVDKWEYTISITGTNPKICNFSGTLYISNLYTDTSNYDLWKLNSSEDDIEFVCYGNDTGYKVNAFLEYNNELFAVLGGTSGRLVKFDGTHWVIVGTCADELVDGIVFDDNLCVISNTGQLYVWDGTTNLISLGSSCSEVITKLCVHSGSLYGGTIAGNLYIFDVDSEVWILDCSGGVSGSINDLISYRGYIYCTKNEWDYSYICRKEGSDWIIKASYTDLYTNITKLFSLTNVLYFYSYNSGYLFRYSGFDIDFNSDINNGLAPLWVSFYSYVDTIYPCTYLWDFDDGSYSADANPTHTFIRGTYSISLTVDDGYDNAYIKKICYIDAYTDETLEIDSLEKLQLIGSPGDIINDIQGYSLRNNYIQTAHIDASETQYWYGGTGFVPIGFSYNSAYNIYNAFEGTFDGDVYTISNLHINYSNNVGLFSVIGNCNLKNIKLLNINIRGINYVGGIAGKQVFYDNFCLIENCFVNGTVHGTERYVGGYIGELDRGRITTSITDVEVIGEDYVGGFIGYSGENIDFSLCEANGIINGSDHIGGFVGFCNFINIVNNVSNATIIGTDSYTGGLIGYLFGDSSYIDACVCTADIEGDFAVGGIIGYFAGVWGTEEGVICNCSFSGSITLSGEEGYVGGIVGYYSGFEVSNCTSISSIEIRSDIGYNKFIGGIIGNGTCTKLEDNNATIEFTFDEQYVYGIGGIAGYLVGDGSVKRCWCRGNITVKECAYVGGLLGDVNGFETIENSYYIGDITSTYSDNTYVGGLFNSSSDLYVDECYTECSIIFGGYVSAVGLLAGYAGGSTITKSYSIGDITLEGDIDSIGGLCGYGKIINNCGVIGNISILYGTGNYVGGLVGYLYSTIINSFYIGNIICYLSRNNNQCGGLFSGYTFDGIINKNHVIGNMSSSCEYCGGITGKLGTGSISECFADMNIEVTNGGSVGGIVGSCSSIIENCYSRGDITITLNSEISNYAGGLVGVLYPHGEVRNCYSTGKVIMLE